MSVRPGSSTSFRIPSRDPVVTECSSLSCELGGVVTEPGAVTAVVIAALATFLAFAYVRDAQAAARQERRRVLDEHDAFQEFADRVAGLEPTPADTQVRTRDTPVAGVHRVDSLAGYGTGGDVTLRRVLTAYRDTILSLPHYTAEYDETTSQSFAAELGPDTVTALASNGTLSAGAQSAIVSRSRQAATARSSLADAIGDEIDALTAAESEIGRIDRRRRRLVEHLDGIDGDGTDAAIDVWERLEGLEAECDDLAADRQQTLNDPPMAPHADASPDADHAFYTYLYGDHSGPTYPVLAQISALATRIHSDSDRVASRIADGS